MDKWKSKLGATVQKGHEGEYNADLLHRLAPRRASDPPSFAALSQQTGQSKQPSSGPSPQSQDHAQQQHHAQHHFSSPSQGSRPPEIRLKCEPRILGLVGDPGMNRDSGGSALFGDRVLWTYRDTNFRYPDGRVCEFPMMSSTASWTDPAHHLDSKKKGLEDHVLMQYGRNPGDKSFYPQVPHICDSPGGMCKDGSRVALWPDQPPLVVPSSGKGRITAYTWIRRAHMDMSMKVLTKYPPTMLYRLDCETSTAQADKDALPKVSIVNEEFWREGEISYGSYGTLIHDDVAYLFAQVGEHGPIALARCSPTSLEDRSRFEYFVSGTWTKDIPHPGHTGIEIENAGAKGQGTFFHNRHWGCFVWIGGDIFPGAECHISTAPRAEGPWTEPFNFWTGASQDHWHGRLLVNDN